MSTDPTIPNNIDEYIAAFPPEIQTILEAVRSTIRKAAPDAEEKISYRMPTFALHGNLVYFGAFKNHIGLFPPVRGYKKLKQEASMYEGEKGNLRFPLDRPIPYSLIGNIVKFRAKEHREKASAKRKTQTGEDARRRGARS